MILQSSSDTFSRWLYTNAPAAWISALIAVASLLFVLRSRKKPGRIVVKEVRNTSVVIIHESIRHRVAVKFDDREVQALAQVELEVFNEGSETIQNAKFLLQFPKQCKVLYATMSPPQPNPALKITNQTVEVSLSYLNAFNPHKQLVKLSVLADGETTPMTISGSGAGWSVRHAIRAARKNFLWEILVSVELMLLLLFGIEMVKNVGGNFRPDWFSLFAGVFALTTIPILILRHIRRLRDW